MKGKGKPENIIGIVRNNGKEYAATSPEMIDLIIENIAKELGIEKPGMVECGSNDPNIKAYTLIDTEIETELETSGVLVGVYPSTHVIFISTYLESYYKSLVALREKPLNNVFPFVKAVH
ncbi:hypothetical protein MM5_056 [Morganella phage vB_Mm5]